MEKEQIKNPETVIDAIQEIMLSEEPGTTPIRALAAIYVLVFPEAGTRLIEELQAIAG